jgi:predicted phosphodiesterase
MDKKDIIKKIEEDEQKGKRQSWAHYGSLVKENPEKVRRWWRTYKNNSDSNYNSNNNTKVTADQKEYTTTELSENKMKSEAVTRKVITSEAEAIEFFKVDLNVWKVIKFKCRSWTTPINGEDYVNTYVALDMERRDESIQDVCDKIKSYLRNNTESKGKSIVNLQSKKRVGVVSCADIHLGAVVKDLIRTPDFNLDILISYLNKVADNVNAHNFSEVHLNLLGDYVESVSGLNHLNTFKSLDSNLVGAKLIKVTSEILSDALISKIHNLKSINMVSGNHDRFTPEKDVDNEGYAGGMICYVLELLHKDINISYHPMLLSKDIDGIRYIMTHGHYLLSKKHALETINKFGNTDNFTTILEGHTHARRQMSSKKIFASKINDIALVEMDDLKYRKIVVPAIFTGNFYSEGLGFSANSGFLITYNNGKGIPNVYDYSL